MKPKPAINAATVSVILSACEIMEYQAKLEGLRVKRKALNKLKRFLKGVIK